MTCPPAPTTGEAASTPRHSRSDGVAVGGGQGADGAAALMHASGLRRLLGTRPIKLVPKPCSSPCDQVAGALADRDHRGDGRDADDDAQDRQGGPHLVLSQGPQGDAERQEQIHGLGFRRLWSRQCTPASAGQAKLDNFAVHLALDRLLTASARPAP